MDFAAQNWRFCGNSNQPNLLPQKPLFVQRNLGKTRLKGLRPCPPQYMRSAGEIDATRLEPGSFIKFYRPPAASVGEGMSVSIVDDEPDIAEYELAGRGRCQITP